MSGAAAASAPPDVAKATEMLEAAKRKKKKIDANFPVLQQIAKNALELKLDTYFAVVENLLRKKSKKDKTKEWDQTKTDVLRFIQDSSNSGLPVDIQNNMEKFRIKIDALQDPIQNKIKKTDWEELKDKENNARKPLSDALSDYEKRSQTKKDGKTAVKAAETVLELALSVKELEPQLRAATDTETKANDDYTAASNNLNQLTKSAPNVSWPNVSDAQKAKNDLKRALDDAKKKKEDLDKELATAKKDLTDAVADAKTASDVIAGSVPVKPLKFAGIWVSDQGVVSFADGKPPDQFLFPTDGVIAVSGVVPIVLSEKTLDSLKVNDLLFLSDEGPVVYSPLPGDPGVATTVAFSAAGHVSHQQLAVMPVSVSMPGASDARWGIPQFGPAVFSDATGSGGAYRAVKGADHTTPPTADQVSFDDGFRVYDVVNLDAMRKDLKGNGVRDSFGVSKDFAALEAELEARFIGTLREKIGSCCAHVDLGGVLVHT